MRLRSFSLLLSALVLALALQAQSAPSPFLEVTPFGNQTDAEVSKTLTQRGFSVTHFENYVAGGTHLYLGPFTPPEAEAARTRLAALGYHVTLVSDPHTVEQTERMQQLEAQANAKLSGEPTPAPLGDLEARALANLGVGSTASQAKPLDPEAAAFAAMQTNSARAAVDAENLRQARLIADQQAEAARLQRELDQANAPPLQESTAATLIRGLSGVVAQSTAAQSQNSIQQAGQQQIAQIHALQQQIATNQAAQAAAQANRQAAAQITPRAATQTSQLPENRAITSSNHSALPMTSPSYSPVDSNGQVSLGTGSPRACATSASGSQLPLVPGTLAGTCNPASCRGVGSSMRLDSHWSDTAKREVVGFFTNNSGSDATCSWAFHKNGVWTDEGQMYVKIDAKHEGGRFGGVWSHGTDSSDIKFICFEGKDPVDVHGKPCNYGIEFTGQTAAGTDK